MPNELQELQLLVSMNDEASESVGKLRDQLKEFSEVASEQMEKFKKEQEEMADQIKELAEVAKGGGEAMVDYIGKFGVAGAAFAGFAGTLLIGFDTLKEFSEKVVALSNTARVIGMHPAELKNVREQYEKVGVSLNVVDQSFGGLADTMAKLSQVGSEKRFEMIRAAGQFGDEMDKAISKVEAQSSLTGKMQQVLISALDVRNNKLKETNGNINAANKAENDFIKQWDVNPALKALIHLSETTEEQKKRMEEQAKATLKFHEEVSELGQQLEEFAEDIETNLLKADGVVVKGLELMIDLVKELHSLWNEGWVGHLQKATKQEFEGKKEEGEEKKKSEEAAPLPQAPLSSPPSNPYGLISGQTTAMPRALDDQMPGISKGWEWMRRSGDIEDRRQVDTSLEQGDDYIKMIKANTAETKRLNDNFRLLDRGQAELKGFGAVPGFDTGGGGQYGGGGATGGWTGANGSNVGPGTGDGAGDSHPSSGKGGGQGTSDDDKGTGPADEQANPASANTTASSIPQKFQSDLTAMTLAGAKPHNIHAYMLAHGINLSEATCGQFMASVVKEHGGVPPKDPAIASNWNKFGGVQGAGYSSDPNAINIAVKQGTGIGSTGSHVTSAVPITDASGKIVGYRGVGVNQGKQGVAGVGQYGRDVITSIPLRIGSRPGEYQIRHEIIKDRDTIDAADGAKKVRTVKVDVGGKLTANVNAPKGADVKVEGGGAFNKTETNRTMPLGG